MTSIRSRTMPIRTHRPFARPTLRLFAGDRRGAAAVEFAVVSSALILTIVFIMMLGLVLYQTQALDRATDVAARQIMTGSVQNGNVGQDSFRTTILCPALPLAVNCNNVIVNVQTVSQTSTPQGYYALVKGDQSGLIIPTLSNGASQYNPGIQGSYVYLQVLYPITFLPSFMVKAFGITSTYGGVPAFVIVSTAAFRNEQY